MKDQLDIEPFKLWHRALEMSDVSQWSDEVKRDFPQPGMGWDAWWAECGHLFQPSVPLMWWNELTSPKDWAQYWKGWKEDGADDGATFALWLNMNAPVEELIERVAAEIRTRHKSKRGGAEDGRTCDEQYALLDRRAKWGPIEASLDVLQQMPGHRKPDSVEWWALGLASKAHKEFKTKADFSKDIHDAGRQRVRLASWTRERWMSGLALIAGVEQGRFPVIG